MRRVLHQKDGALFRPYIHRKREHIPEHFADGGYPVIFKDQETAPGPVALQNSPFPPIAVASRSLLKDDLDWQELQRSLASNLPPSRGR